MYNEMLVNANHVCVQQGRQSQGWLQRALPVFYTRLGLNFGKVVSFQVLITFSVQPVLPFFSLVVDGDFKMVCGRCYPPWLLLQPIAVFHLGRLKEGVPLNVPFTRPNLLCAWRLEQVHGKGGPEKMKLGSSFF